MFPAPSWLLLLVVPGTTAFVTPPNIISRGHISPQQTGLPIMASLSLPDDAFATIDQGQIAVVPNFLSTSQVSRLRQDAQQLYRDGHFITDAIAGYGKSQQAVDKAAFDPSRDRSVLPAYIPSKQLAGPFVNSKLGDSVARQEFTKTIASLRRELAIGLDRPGMDTPDSPNNHEISMTRFGPGACLKRHTDEHHEELKGTAGWRLPTRRSTSWLVYLNEDDWSPDTDGGCLRTFARNSPSAAKVGSRHGDLQIGWLTATVTDPVDRPVFLDGRRGGQSGQCALYMDGDSSASSRLYLTETFSADPYLFLAMGDLVVQKVLIQNPQYKTRFHYLEPPKSKLSASLAHGNNSANDGERVLDAPPMGGTLVMFDSVALPHEVLATVGRERWATSGWFHEAQQEVPWKEQQQRMI